jgi:hypothetical protein
MTYEFLNILEEWSDYIKIFVSYDDDVDEIIVKEGDFLRFNNDIIRFDRYEVKSFHKNFGPSYRTILHVAGIKYCNGELINGSISLDSKKKNQFSIIKSGEDIDNMKKLMATSGSL